MGATVTARIQALARQVLDSYPGAWLVWCDPRGDWLPLLQRAAGDTQLGGFTLVEIRERTAGEPGSPAARRQLLERIATGESFVLHVAAAPDALGWLWAPALRAEQIYSRPLREQLVEWGWRPHSLTVADDELAVLARRNADRDPAEWGGGGLQPDLPTLLEVLAGGADPDPEQRLVLDLTVEAAGLPAIDDADVGRWRAAVLARLLVTQAREVAPEAIHETHELLVPVAQRHLALKVLAQWADSLRLGKSLPDAILCADRIAGLGALVSSVGPGLAPFLSHAAEAAVFAATCARLARLAGRELLEAVAATVADAERHAAGIWGEASSHPRAVPWGELLRLGRAARALLDATPEARWVGPREAVTWYVSGGWRVDQAGEELMRTLDRPAPELLALVEPLRAAYRARWEQLMLEWSEVWEGAGCPEPDLPTAGEWAAETLRAPRPTALLVVDALRFDLGAGLAARVNHQEGAERASIVPARAPLPTLTTLGMGAALPLPERELTADLVDGKWRLLYRDRESETDLSVAARRRAWLRDHAGVPESGFLTLAEVLAGRVPAPEAGRTRLVVADDAIDKLGHEDQLELTGSGPALARYAAAIARLRDAGWLRVLVVTDHGFIHWSASEEKSVEPPLPDVAFLSRRAVAYPARVVVPGPSALSPGGKWRVAVARGASSFRAYGARGYYHGGASLQEWVIPCLKVEWPLDAKPVGVELQPLPQVLGQRPRVTLLVVRSSLLVEESIPRQVDVVIHDTAKQTIIFRSEPVSVTPDQDRVAVTVAVVPGIAAQRGTPLRIEVRDKRDDGVIASAESKLMTEITDW